MNKATSPISLEDTSSSLESLDESTISTLLDLDLGGLLEVKALFHLFALRATSLNFKFSIFASSSPNFFLCCISISLSS